MDNLNPQWNESYHLDVCHYANELAFEVRDKDATSAEFIGSVAFFTTDLANGEIKEGNFPIQRKDRTIKGELELRVQVCFTYCSSI